MRKRVPVLVAVMLVLGACSSGGEGEPKGSASDFEKPASGQVYAQFASSDLAVGENRVLVGLLNDDDAPIGSPEIEVQIDYFDLGESATEPVMSSDPHFVWSIKPRVGLYADNVSFESAGKWGAEISVLGDGYDETLKTSLEVKEDSATPAVGEEVPATDNPTLDDVGDISKISTDKHPDPSFYKTTVKGALADHEPFVLIFATPKFCQSQTCGPMLYQVKKIAPDFPDVTFIHVEPYKLPPDPNNLAPVKAAEQWELPTEPWVFVVDDRGKLVAKFEGALASEGLADILEQL
jgi:hypothetical protein